jgi:hypothetical protein
MQPKMIRLNWKPISAWTRDLAVPSIDLAPAVQNENVCDVRGLML